MAYALFFSLALIPTHAALKLPSMKSSFLKNCISPHLGFHLKDTLENPSGQNLPWPHLLMQLLRQQMEPLVDEFGEWRETAAERKF